MTILIVAGGWAAGLVVVLALCRAACQGDRALTSREPH
jgi:hypothetical protein